MTGPLRFARHILADKRGITSLEYGIMASILAVTLLGIISSFAKTVTGLFSAISTSI